MNEVTDKMKLPDNALDYLLSAVEPQEQRIERSVKYSILHLFAGIELLLKERLKREHWSLIFQDLRQANQMKLNDGDFRSVDFDTSVERLANIAGVNLTKSEKNHLKSLRMLRNRMQHFYSTTGQAEATSRLAKGLNFAVHFIANEMPDLNSAKKAELDQIHGALMQFDEYIDFRTNEIKNSLSSFKCTVCCPRCDQETLGLGNGNPLCPFCGFTDEPFEAMAAAAGGAVIGECPSCRGPMGEYSCHGDEESHDMFICFSCGAAER